MYKVWVSKKIVLFWIPIRTALASSMAFTTRAVFRDMFSSSGGKRSPLLCGPGRGSQPVTVNRDISQQ